MLICHTHTNSIFQYFLIFFFHFIYLRNKNRSSKKVEKNRIHFCKFVIFSCALSTVTGARAKKSKRKPSKPNPTNISIGTTKKWKRKSSCWSLSQNMSWNFVVSHIKQQQKSTHTHITQHICEKKVPKWIQTPTI